MASSRTVSKAVLRWIRAKAKIFLGSWRPGEKHVVELPLTCRRTPQAEIRSRILRGLHRLYEGGFKEENCQFDLAGIGFELGVTEDLVIRAVNFLYGQGLLDDGGAISLPRRWGEFTWTPQGIQHVEAELVPVETFLQELYGSTLGNLASLDSNLESSLIHLRECAGSIGTAREDLVGFASMVREFIERLTDHLYGLTGNAESIAKSRTINKVKAITASASAASTSGGAHVQALAEVVDTHWRRLNDVQQKGVHSGTVESQRLFAYTLLFVADLMDVWGSKDR